MQKQMSLVENISVIQEEEKFLLHFLTKNGFFACPISEELALEIETAMLGTENISVCSQIMQDHDLVMNQLYIVWEGTHMNAIATVNAKIYEGRLIDFLPIAIEHKTPILIETAIVREDYLPNDMPHEMMVEELIQEELEYWLSQRTQELSYRLDQAILEERYEEAAKIRDEIKDVTSHQMGK